MVALTALYKKHIKNDFWQFQDLGHPPAPLTDMATKFKLLYFIDLNYNIYTIYFILYIIHYCHKYVILCFIIRVWYFLIILSTILPLSERSGPRSHFSWMMVKKIFDLRGRLDVQQGLIVAMPIKTVSF